MRLLTHNGAVYRLLGTIKLDGRRLALLVNMEGAPKHIQMDPRELRESQFLPDPDKSASTPPSSAS